MSRLFSVVCAAALVFLAVSSLTGCGGSSKFVGFGTPAIIILTPSGSASMDLGANQQFTAQATNAQHQSVTVPITFHSSNTSVVTVSNGGLVCAGSWDSVSSPQVCTPGQPGTADVTATSNGVSSPATTVYVHPHIDSIVVSPVPPPPTTPCTSKDLVVNYQASAFSRGVDITSSVGQFTWTAVNNQVTKLSNTATGLQNMVNGVSLNQVQATAGLPGTTPFFASVANVTSVPMTFNTCAVRSISLAVTGTDSTSFSVKAGSGASITATVIDSLGATITGAPLTWNSSLSAVAKGPTTSVDVGNVTTSKAGTASVIASCTPPTCNIGISPSLPIYPAAPIVATATPTGSTASGSVWVSTEGCGTTDSCISTAVPINQPDNTVGTGVNLPATPNSMLFSPDGSKLFLGTNDSLQGTRGLMVVDPSAAPPTVTVHNPITGKALAISSNSAKVLVSDTQATPNQVYVYDTTSGTAVAFQITGATAAAFSPDNLKAYIAAGSTLFVYSTQDALQSIPLSFPVQDVTFLSEGAFAYLAGDGIANGVTARRTCDNGIATDAQGTPQIIPTNGKLAFLRSLPDSSKILAVDSPGIDLIDIFDPVTGANTINAAGCTTTVGVSPFAVQSFNLGLGGFTAKQLIVSTDGAKAYILTQELPVVLVFDITNLIPLGVALANGASPLQASLTTDGSLLYVGASDGQVHVIDTLANNDVQQVSFPNNPLLLQSGLCNNVTSQTVVNISAASRSGNNTTYTYTLVTGADLQGGESIIITGMTDAGNNGRFTVTAAGGGTFTVINANGVNASGQNGTGTVTFVCNADLVAVRP